MIRNWYWTASSEFVVIMFGEIGRSILMDPCSRWYFARRERVGQMAEIRGTFVTAESLNLFVAEILKPIFGV